MGPPASLGIYVLMKKVLGPTLGRFLKKWTGEGDQPGARDKETNQGQGTQTKQTEAQEAPSL